MTVGRSADGWIVVGEIDASTAPTLEKAFHDLPDGDGRVVLDLSDVSFIDSSGLLAALAAMEPVAYCGPPTEIHDRVRSTVCGPPREPTRSAW